MNAIPIELQAPDIAPHRQSGTGVDWIHTFESGKPGPHVLVNALTHGNEICGALVVDRLLREGLRPVRGALTLAFANVAAFSRFDPAHPYASRFVDEDFNRVWTPATLDGPRRSTELARARELRPFVEAADFLLDIHSMLEPSPPVMICGPLEKGIRMAFDVGIPEHVVSDTGHANGTRMRDYGGFGDPSSPKNALLVECGQHWERNAEVVAWQTTWRPAQECMSSSRLRMSMASWSVSDSCWLASVVDSALPISAIELNELCVPIHGALRSGSVRDRRSWKASERCVHERS